MCTSKGPKPPPALPEAPVTPDIAASSAASDSAKRKRAAAGASSTILTGSSGLTSTANTSQKTLLGA